MTDAFSSQSAEAITRSLDIEAAPAPSELGLSLSDAYEIPQTLEKVKQHAFKRVALQFPDEMLPYSVPVYRALKAGSPETEFYVLADTSYGSCCVDEVAAQHVDADAVVHYGHACLSPTSRLPTIYVFPRRPIDPPHCAQSLADARKSASNSLDSLSPSAIVIMLDVAYHYRADEIHHEVKSRIPANTTTHMWSLDDRLVPPSTSNASGAGASSPEHTSTSLSSRPRDRHELPEGANPERTVILYVGGESLALNNILMRHSGQPVFSYDPESKTSRLESPKSNRLLMRRYAVVNKAHDADVFGILVGTLGVAQYLPVITQLRRMIAARRKKSYTVSVGKLNPAKLANFMEIECFVLVACPENSIVDAKEFYRPIITPHELVAALSPEIQWSGDYSLDFEHVLRISAARLQGNDGDSDVGGRDAVGIDSTTHDGDDNDDDDDRPSFSLISGSYRHAKRYDASGDSPDKEARAQIDHTPSNNNSSKLTSRNQDARTLALANQSAAATFLHGRTYQGLEQNLGQDPPSVLEQGRSGVAQGYGSEH